MVIKTIFVWNCELKINEFVIGFLVAIFFGQNIETFVEKGALFFHFIKTHFLVNQNCHKKHIVSMFKCIKLSTNSSIYILHSPLTKNNLYGQSTVHKISIKLSFCLSFSLFCLLWSSYRQTDTWQANGFNLFSYKEFVITVIVLIHWGSRYIWNIWNIQR